MTKKVLIIKNIIREGTGLLEILLTKYNIDSDLIELGKGEKFPDPHGYNAVFVFGGPDSANDTTPKMLQELGQIKKLITAGIPYLGACLGMQTLVKALGGEIYKNNVSEIGWRDPDNQLFKIDLTEEGKKDKLFEGLTSPLKIFHLHGETVRLTPNMKLLATGRLCRN